MSVAGNGGRVFCMLFVEYANLFLFRNTLFVMKTLNDDMPQCVYVVSPVVTGCG